MYRNISKKTLLSVVALIVTVQLVFVLAPNASFILAKTAQVINGMSESIDGGLYVNKNGNNTLLANANSVKSESTKKESKETLSAPSNSELVSLTLKFKDSDGVIVEREVKGISSEDKKDTGKPEDNNLEKGKNKVFTLETIDIEPVLSTPVPTATPATTPTVTLNPNATSTPAITPIVTFSPNATPVITPIITATPKVTATPIPTVIVTPAPSVAVAVADNSDLASLTFKFKNSDGTITEHTVKGVSSENKNENADSKDNNSEKGKSKIFTLETVDSASDIITPAVAPVASAIPSTTPEISVDPKASATPKPSTSPKASATPKPSTSPKASATPKATTSPKVSATPSTAETTPTPNPLSSPELSLSPKPETTNPEISLLPSSSIAATSEPEATIENTPTVEVSEQCQKENIFDPAQCDTYLKSKNTNKECIAANTNSEGECSEILFKKYSPLECQKAGIENEDACKEFMLSIYIPKVTCTDKGEDACKKDVEEKYLGNIVAKQADYVKISEETVSLREQTIKADDFREKVGETRKEMIPIVENAELKIVVAENRMTVNKDNELVQTAPIAIMIDSDSDGLTDDMEKRMGTDANNPDSDGDGFKDGEEVKSGNNPLGEGKLEEGKISPIDEVILNNKTLGHPKVAEVESSDKYSFDKVSNVEAGQGTTVNAKYVFSGKAESNSVVTLYIYSDLPIVVTVKTDKYGNWNYEFDKSLVDGEHEAYVVLNDNTGKVVAKSNALSFFVNEAKAMSVKDFISPESATPAEETAKTMNNYVFVTISVIVVGIIIFIGLIFILNKRKGVPKV